MKCRKVQDLLITDYSDGELKPGKIKIIEKHLETCRECGLFKEKVSSLSSTILESGGLLKTPEHLWREVNRQTSSKGGLFETLYLRINGILYSLKPAILSGGVVFAVLLFSLRGFMELKAFNSVMYVDEQLDFLDSLSSGIDGSYDDIGIPVEDIVN